MVLYLYLQTLCPKNDTGINYIDSTKLEACDPHRIHSNKVFKGVASRGKTSTGWFYGIKLHLAINQFGELTGFTFSSGSVSDCNILIVEQVCKFLGRGTIFGDAGYVSQKLFENLFGKGLKMITKIRKNMKNKLISKSEKYFLKNRSLIETVIDLLKHIQDLWNTRHRSIENAFNNILSALTAYSFMDKKPSLKNERFKIALF